MNFKCYILACTVAVFSASGAMAADAISYGEPSPPAFVPTFTWNGGYIGGQVGYGWGKSRFVDNRYGWDEIEPNGFLGGLYAGYNFDLGNNLILGIDGDITYNNLDDSNSQTYTNGSSDYLESALRWSGAVRGRAGYAFDRFLPYIAGGVAFGNIENTFEDNRFFASHRQTLTGWTAGAGVDYAATDNLVLRLEYRYTDYGNDDFDLGRTSDTSINNSFKTNEVRLGIAYKF